jgi:hypothetical protein
MQPDIAGKHLVRFAGNHDVSSWRACLTQKELQR